MQLELWQAIIPVASGLIGSVTTYMMTYLSTQLENRKRIQEKKAEEQRKNLQKQREAIKTFLNSLRKSQLEMSTPELNRWIEVHPGHSILCDEGRRARENFQQRIIAFWEIMDLDLIDPDVRLASEELGDFLSTPFSATTFMYDQFANPNDENKAELKRLLDTLRKKAATQQSK